MAHPLTEWTPHKVGKAKVYMRLNADNGSWEVMIEYPKGLIWTKELYSGDITQEEMLACIIQKYRTQLY